VDFRRDKLGVPAKVAAIEYDPNRSANLALLHYADGENATSSIRWDWKWARRFRPARVRTFFPGNALQFKHIPPARWFTTWSCIPGAAGKWCVPRAGSAQLLSKEGDLALVKLPSGEVRKFSIECMATVGQVGNLDHRERNVRKSRAHAVARKKPTVRGVAMNPVVIRTAAAKARSRAIIRRRLGFPTLGKKTRNNKRTDKHIVERRK